MYSNVDIHETDKKIIVTIKPQKTAIYKITLAIMSILILSAPIVTAIIFFTQHLKMNIENLLLVGLNIVLIIFIYKHLRTVYRKEIITIENNKLTYNNSFLGLGKYFETKVNEIKAFKHVGYSQQTKHPLDIKGDVLGFGTQEGEINYLNQTGTMIIATEYHVLKFGVDVDEEDYFKIKRLVD